MGRNRRQAQATRKKVRKMVPKGQAHIYAAFNNTIVTITDTKGNTVAWSSSGASGFKGSRKSTPYAARLAGQNAARIAVENGVQEVDVVVKGPGPGREAAIRSIQASGIRVTSIQDITPVPHNGCRPPKKRRIYFIQLAGSRGGKKGRQACKPLSTGWRAVGPRTILGGNQVGTLHRSCVPVVPARRRKTILEGVAVSDPEVFGRTPHLSAGATWQGKSVPPWPRLGLFVAAAREAEGPPHLRCAGAAV